MKEEALHDAVGAGKKRAWLKWGALAACLCVLGVAAALVLPGLFDAAPADAGGITIHWDGVKVSESSGAGDDISRLYLSPSLYDAESWGQAEIAAYFGRELTVPYVPAGLIDGGVEVSATVYRSKATGELIEDEVSRGYWAAYWSDGSPTSDDDIIIPRGFTVRASKIGLLTCGLLPVNGARTTDFGGVEVTLLHASLPHGPYDSTQQAPDGGNMPAGYYDVYVARFEQDGAQYEVEAQRIELEEIVKIVASVINTPQQAGFTVG